MEMRSLSVYVGDCTHIVRVRFNRKAISVRYYSTSFGNRMWKPVPVKNRLKMFEDLTYFDGVSIETGQIKFLANYLKKATANYPLPVRKHVVRKALRIKGAELIKVVEFLHLNPLGVRTVIDLFAKRLSEQVIELRGWVNDLKPSGLTFDQVSSTLSRQLQDLGRG